jgi:hypothetical protein
MQGITQPRLTATVESRLHQFPKRVIASYFMLEEYDDINASSDLVSYEQNAVMIICKKSICKLLYDGEFPRKSTFVRNANARGSS